MVAGPDALAGIATPTPDERALLQDPMRPVVLLRRHPACDLPDALAPGCTEIGVLLPYSPLHHLLLAAHGGPLVATSANPSGEPVLTDNAEAATRLGHIADAFLHHDRPIARPADDPVFRVIAGAPRPIRLGRGNAPLEVALPIPLDRPTLALGGQMKATLALGWGDRAVVSPHLGDMDTPRSLALLQDVARDLQALFGVTAERIACDAHPGYASTRLARRMRTAGGPCLAPFRPRLRPGRRVRPVGGSDRVHLGRHRPGPGRLDLGRRGPGRPPRHLAPRRQPASLLAARRRPRGPPAVALRPGAVLGNRA